MDTIRASSSSGTVLGWPVWNQGPYAHGAGGGGWRPVTAVNRRRASAGRGPANTNSSSVRASADTDHRLRRPAPRSNVLRSSFPTSAPYPRLDRIQGTG